MTIIQAQEELTAFINVVEIAFQESQPFSFHTCFTCNSTCLQEKGEFERSQQRSTLNVAEATRQEPNCVQLDEARYKNGGKRGQGEKLELP